MADGNDKVPEIKGNQPEDASQAFHAELQQIGDRGAKPGDQVQQIATVGDANNGYSFNPADLTGAVGERFSAGSPAENYANSPKFIEAVYAKVTTDEGKQLLNNAAQQMIEHFKTPGLEKLVST